MAASAEATIRRTLARVDPTALATAIGAWLIDRDRPGPGRRRRRRAVAVDGKTLRGARNAQGWQVHLLAAMDHITRAVLAQRQVDALEQAGCYRVFIETASGALTGRPVLEQASTNSAPR